MAAARAAAGRRLIRIHFDRDCAEARGDHFHRSLPVRAPVGQALQRVAPGLRASHWRTFEGERHLVLERRKRRLDQDENLGRGIGRDLGSYRRRVLPACSRSTFCRFGSMRLRA